MKAKNDMEGECQEGSQAVWVEGRGCARSGQMEKNDMDEWKQQPLAKWKKCCLNDDENRES